MIGSFSDIADGAVLKPREKRRKSGIAEKSKILKKLALLGHRLYVGRLAYPIISVRDRICQKMLSSSKSFTNTAIISSYRSALLRGSGRIKIDNFHFLICCKGRFSMNMIQAESGYGQLFLTFRFGVLVTHIAL